MSTFHFSMEELCVLGAATVVPPRYLTPEDVEIVTESLRRRFSDEGREEYVRESCLKTEEQGFSVPEGKDEFIVRERCAEMLLEEDFRVYAPKQVESLLRRLEEFSHAVEDTPEDYPN